MNNFIYTVTQLNNHAKSVLENTIKNVWLRGEISSFKKYSSGHAYFILKDSSSEISCTIFNYSDSLNFENGINITVSGEVTIYSTKGKFQIIVKDSYIDGSGIFFAGLNKLKKKLFNEGLFDKSSKKKLPQFPSNVGIITSIDGSVMKDLTNILERRCPYLNIIIKNTLVQGKSASKMLVDSIMIFNDLNNVDVLVIARGGGSSEDLMCFNDEKVIRAIYNSKIPVISAIGHETDYTLCDLAADVRVSTPSEAAEIIAPSIEDLYQMIDSKLYSLKMKVDSLISNNNLFVNIHLIKNLAERKKDFLNHKISHLSTIIDRIQFYSKAKIQKHFLNIEGIKKNLKNNNIDHLKKIGFSIVCKNNKIIVDKNNLVINDNISIEFTNGHVIATVKEIYD